MGAAPNTKSFVDCIGTDVTNTTSSSGSALRGLTVDADQKSSIVVPSATVVPLTSMIQNNADRSGRARISQRRRMLLSPGRALVVGHVITGASGDKQVVISAAINSQSRAAITSKLLHADYCNFYATL